MSNKMLMSVSVDDSSDEGNITNYALRSINGHCEINVQEQRERERGGEQNITDKSKKDLKHRSFKKIYG